VKEGEALREIAAKRTRFSKTYELGDGQRRVEIGQLPMHFERDGLLHDIDLRHEADDARGQFVFRNCPYSLRIDRQAPAYAYNSLGGKRVSVELVTDARGCLAEGGLYKWAEVGKATDYVIQPLPAGCATLLILNGPDSPREWSWRVNGDMGLIVPLVGKDSAGRRLELIETRDVKAGLIGMRWTGRTVAPGVLRHLQRTQWSDNVTWPVIIDPTVNEAVAANEDDAFSVWAADGTAFASFNAGGSVAYAGRYNTLRLYGGVRFQTVPVPNAASLNSATLTLNVIIVNGTPDINIFGNDIDDAAAWADPGNRVKNITKTSAVTNKAIWSAGTDNSIDVASIVSEIISRAGWASNNDMAFGLFNNAADGVDNMVFAALEHATLTEARLSISYGAADPVTTRMTGRGLTQSRLLKRPALVN
jgi:hypothetical protein